MKNKLIVILTALTLTLGLTSCATETKEKTPVVATFATEYEMKGTTSAGLPKSDTFIFEGTTENDIITELNFDIVRNKGLENELSKKDIMGYEMNVSDVEIEKVGDDYNLNKLSIAGYDDAFEGGQFMVVASAEAITDTTTLKDLTMVNLFGQDELEFDVAIAAYKYIAAEAGIEDANEDTLLKDIISKYDLYKDGSFVEGSTRISFAGYNGGRSYGEQIEAIVTHILKEEMTLEDVYEMFKTVNPIDQPIAERDAVSGATITFVGDFQRMVYLAMHGELFEGVITHREVDGEMRVEVTTQGYGGEVVTHVTFDSAGKIVKIAIRDAQETDEIGGVLTSEDSNFINSLIAGQDKVSDVEVVSGATMTSEALTKAVEFAIEYYEGL